MEQKNELAVKQDNTVAALLKREDIRARFDDLMGKKAPGFVSSIISAVALNPRLKECEPSSVISAAAVAGALDLPINPSLGFAHIVPYKDKDGKPIAQFQIGWRGLVQLAMRTGQYSAINVTDVREGELVKSDKFTGEMEFDESQRKSESIIGYVAFFRLVNGFEKWYYMDVAQVRAHGAKYSRSYQSAQGKWQLDFDAMARKTVLKMLLSKYGILTVAMQEAIIKDQAAIDADGNPRYVDNPEGDPEAPRPLKRGRKTGNKGDPTGATPAEVVGDDTRRKEIITRIEARMVTNAITMESHLLKEGVSMEDWQKADTDILAAALARFGGNNG